MRKVIIALLILVILGASGATAWFLMQEEPPKEAIARIINKTDNLVATEDDFDNLKKYLDETAYALWCGNKEYDCEKASAEDIITNYISIGFQYYVYNYYFKDAEEIIGEKQPDPRGKYEYSYYKFPADNVDWIIKNIFNATPAREAKSNNADMETVYYQDGYYYRMAGDAGFQSPETKMTYELAKDGKYLIKFVSSYLALEEQGSTNVSTHYILADLKMLNDKREWTFYKISQKPIKE